MQPSLRVQIVFVGRSDVARVRVTARHGNGILRATASKISVTENHPRTLQQ